MLKFYFIFLNTFLNGRIECQSCVDLKNKRYCVSLFVPVSCFNFVHILIQVSFLFNFLLKTFAGWLRFLLDHYHVRHFFLKRLETDINVPLSIWEYNISIVLTTMNAMSSHNASSIEFSPEVENPKQWLTNVLANIVDISLSSQAIFCCSLGFFLCSF